MKHLFITIFAIAQVVFASNIHCAKCAEKVRENISYEKGVKDLKVDADTKLITVTFNTSKTDTLKLQKAIGKLGYTAKVVEYKEN